MCKPSKIKGVFSIMPMKGYCSCIPATFSVSHLAYFQPLHHYFIDLLPATAKHKTPVMK